MTESDRTTLPTYWQLLVFFIPLALSSSMMTLEPLIINGFLSLAPDTEVTLAAYSVLFGIALVVEAPVLMLVSASTALTRSQDAYRQLRRFTLVLGSGTVVAGLILYFTPLYWVLVRDLMNIPPAVAEAARPALFIMAVWPFPIAWRRMHQGVLIAHNKTPLVTLATLVRLGALAAALAVGRMLMPDRMLVAGAIAMQVSVVSESLVVTGPALGIVRKLPAGPGERPLTRQRLLDFYQPLAVMMVLRQIGRPLLSAGIAAALMPQRSLAAWSVTWSIALLPFGMTMGLEQVAIAKGTTPANMVRVRRFVWGVGLTLAGTLLLLTYTPLVHPFLDLLFDLTPEIKPLVITGLRWVVVLPLFQSLQGMLRGTAIGDGRTRDVRMAVAISLAAVILITIAGPRVAGCTGVIIGAVATLSSALAEAIWLAWREGQTRRLAAAVA